MTKRTAPKKKLSLKKKSVRTLGAEDMANAGGGGGAAAPQTATCGNCTPGDTFNGCDAGTNPVSRRQRV